MTVKKALIGAAALCFLASTAAAQQSTTNCQTFGAATNCNTQQSSDPFAALAQMGQQRRQRQAQEAQQAAQQSIIAKGQELCMSVLDKLRAGSLRPYFDCMQEQATKLDADGVDPNIVVDAARPVCTPIKDEALEAVAACDIGLNQPGMAKIRPSRLIAKGETPPCALFFSTAQHENLQPRN
jgi:hypothetical protein